MRNTILMVLAAWLAANIASAQSYNNAGDITLGNKAVALGTRLRDGSLKPNELGLAIRNEICNPEWR